MRSCKTQNTLFSYHTRGFHGTVNAVSCRDRALWQNAGGVQFSWRYRLRVCRDGACGGELSHIQLFAVLSGGQTLVRDLGSFDGRILSVSRAFVADAVRWDGDAMRLLLTGGGTAGHINPALAIAETVKQNDPSAVIEFVGIRKGKETDLVPREGYKLHYVQSMGIKRSLSPSNIKALWLAWRSPKLKETQKILDDFQPDLVIGTGGYASWPIMKAAADRGIPTAVHESNALAGLTVRRLQKYVDRIWINFSETAEGLREKDKTVRVGNPLRGGFGAISREEARRRLGLSDGQTLLLSFGGSLGAEAVNAAAIRLMKDFVSKHPDLIHVHATGKRDWEASHRRFCEAGLESCPNCILMDYIYDMPLRMAAADVTVSRAGAMTLSELALMRKACVLIPSPNVTDDHQYRNAKALSDAGAAILVEEKTLDGGSLTESVSELLGDTAKQSAMREKITAFADANANRLIWNEIQELLKK